MDDAYLVYKKDFENFLKHENNNLSIQIRKDDIIKQNKIIVIKSHNNIQRYYYCCSESIAFEKIKKNYKICDYCFSGCKLHIYDSRKDKLKRLLK